MKTKEMIFQEEKQRKLMLGLLFDAIGLISYSVLGFAESIDFIWAPLAGFLMTYMYKGRVGKIAGFFAFLEEILPFTDIIPSFTLTWFYTYYIQKKDSN